VREGAEAVWAVVGAVAGLADAAGGHSGDARAVIVLDWGNVGAPCGSRCCIGARSSRTGAPGALVLYPNRKEVKGGRTKMY